jgi:glycosyltransferase involved in cell wall biosynthesis
LNYKEDQISILIPTRLRPKNVKRLINSALRTAKDNSKLEFLFYVDDDDNSFPKELRSSKIKVFRGPRTWLSSSYNYLLLQASGEIIMYCGDDIVFRTKYWDETIREEFNKVADKICLVYTNDGVNQSQNIARHGFVHRQWFNSTGWAIPALRMMPIDLWLTDLAKQLSRIKYLESIVIEHVHFRQGKKAKLDLTYHQANERARSWNSLITYSNLKYDLRIDYLLLCEAIKVKPKFNFSYFLGHIISSGSFIPKLDKVNTRRFRSLNNYQMLLLILRKIRNTFRHK